MDAAFTALIWAVLLGLVTYRVGRFIVLDDLIVGIRDRVETVLERNAHVLVWRKLHQLIGCAFCVTIWVSAGATLVTDAITEVPMPVWVWLGAATVAVVVWNQLDSE